MSDAEPDAAPDVVLGQGSLGTLFATVLARTDRPVTVVSRRADKASSRQLSASAGSASLEAEVTVAPKPPERARIVVVATRSDQALERARGVEDALVDDGVIVPVQNGLTSLQVADALDTSQVAPTVVGFNAHLTDGTHAEITSPGDVTTGPLNRSAGPGVDAFVEAIEGPLSVKRTDDPRGAVWSKWCVSCAINGLAVVTGEGVGPMTQRREGREALLSIVTECVDLAEASHVETQRVAGPFKPGALAGNATSGLGGAFRRGVAWLIGRRYSGVTPSSVDALRDGRDPEIDALNAKAVELGEELGIETPWNQATLELAEQVVHGDLEPALDNLGTLRGLVPE